MTRQEKIEWIIENRKMLSTIPNIRVSDEIEKINGFGKKRDYLLIDLNRRSSLAREVSVIFISGGVWQYNFLNVQPQNHKYFSLNQCLDLIIFLMKRYQ